MLVSNKVLEDEVEYLLNVKVGDVVKLVKGDPIFWNDRGLMDKFENTIQVVAEVTYDEVGTRVFFKDGGNKDLERDPDVINSWYWRPMSKCMISAEKYKTKIKVKFKP